MKVLVLGSGGREHAICWSLNNSPLVNGLYCYPGNAGIAMIATCQDVAVDDIATIIGNCLVFNIDLVVVGPEVPLVNGIVDKLEAEGIKVFGPNAAAARLEGSKAFMKEFCKRHFICTAPFKICNSSNEAREHLKERGAPVVIKDDALAAGKGVIVADTLEEALAGVDSLVNDLNTQKFVIEDKLEGTEVSFFALCDNNISIALGAAQDYKRVGDGDTGANTGGMGTFSPTEFVPSHIEDDLLNNFVEPILDGMVAEGHPYKGVLFCGLMLTNDGWYLLEYNVRFGDPETQVILPLLKTDFMELLLATVNDELNEIEVIWKDEAAVCIVMANRGYPKSYQKGSIIRGLDEVKDALVFHAGTKQEGDYIKAVGGRVLNIVGSGPTIQDARTHAYSEIDLIKWPQGFCRRDIAEGK